MNNLRKGKSFEFFSLWIGCDESFDNPFVEKISKLNHKLIRNIFNWRQPVVISAVLLKSTFFALLFIPFKLGMGRIDSIFFIFAQSDEAIIMLSLRKQKNTPTLGLDAKTVNSEYPADVVYISSFYYF